MNSIHTYKYWETEQMSELTRFSIGRHKIITKFYYLQNARMTTSLESAPRTVSRPE